MHQNPPDVSTKFKVLGLQIQVLFQHQNRIKMFR